MRLRIHPVKTKILSNQSIMNSDTKKELEMEDMKIEILTRNESVKCFRSENLHQPTRNDGNQEPYQGCMGDIPQIQTTVDIEKLHAQTSSTAIRGHSISDCLLRSWNMGTQLRYLLNYRLRLFDATVSPTMLRSRNMDTEQRTRKKDSIDATKDATTHHPNKKEIHKDRETRN